MIERERGCLGTEYCGNPEHHEYELYLALEDIDHSRTKTKSPQTNGIVERFHKTVLDEFYRVAFCKKIYGSIAELQGDLDDWVNNEERPHQGRWCFGKTPMQTFLDGTPLGEGENDRRLSKPDRRTRPNSRRRPSDQVQATTPTSSRRVERRGPQEQAPSARVRPWPPGLTRQLPDRAS